MFAKGVPVLQLSETENVEREKVNWESRFPKGELIS